MHPPFAHEIVTTRVFAAPRETVFGAFRDPLRLSRWWGPAGFTNTFQAFEFRPGGSWKFTMHAPDGARFEMDHRFTEILAPEWVVVRHLQPGHDFSLAMLFKAQGDHTQLTWRMLFDDPAEAEKVRAFVLPANEQNFDRLAAHLAETVSRMREPAR